MKKILLCSFFIPLLAFINLNAEDADIKKIHQALTILEKANESHKEIQKTEKTPRQIIEEMRVEKEKATLSASQGEFDEKSLNERIDKIVSYYENEASAIESYTIKAYGVYQECEKEKCITIAQVNASELETALNQLKQNSKTQIKSNLKAAKALKTITPLSSRKTRVETFENEVYTPETTTNSAISSYQATNNTDEASVSLIDKETINGKFIVNITGYQVEIKEK
jgi:hypothetical protein